MHSHIKAIETKYKGYKFRSRLEARWAVFFDHLGIEWEYEKEGFHVERFADYDHEVNCSSRWKYLPDFYLPNTQTWVEVKGDLQSVDDDYLEMIANCIDWRGALPGASDSYGTTRGLLWLGPLPSDYQLTHGTPAHAILQHDKGGHVNICQFDALRGIYCKEGRYGSGYFDTSWGGISAGQAIRKALLETAYSEYSIYYMRVTGCTYAVREAYVAARQARFEHGQTPKGGK